VEAVAFANLLVALPLESHARTISLLSDSTFFVYVTHSVVLSNIRQALLVLLPFHLSEATVFLFTAILTVAFCVSVYLFVRKCFPQLCVFICGR
jgi:surface polysaccharide O-acyltransferase-like enzyme